MWFFNSSKITREKIVSWEKRKKIKKLISALDLEADIGNMATEALINIADNQVVEPLLHILKHSENSDTSRRAAMVLGKLGDTRAIGPLSDVLKNEANDGSDAYGPIGGASDAAIDVLCDLKAFPQLLEALKERPRIQASAASALGKLQDKRAVEPLIELLRSKLNLENYQDSEVAVYVVGALGELGDNRAIDTLVYVLESEAGEASQEAAAALGDLGDQLAVEPLITHLMSKQKESHGTPGCFSASKAVGALGRLGGNKAINAVIKALQFEADHVVTTAVATLGHLGDLRAVGPITEYLNRYKHELGGQATHGAIVAIEALGKLGGSTAVDSLIYALQFEEDNVRIAAIEELGNLGDKRAVEPLINALRDEYDYLRGNVIRSLGLIGDVKAVKPLTDVSKNDSSSDLREAAEEIIKNLMTKKQF